MVRGEILYSGELFTLAKSSDQRSINKEKIKRGKTCEKGILQDESETENEKKRNEW